MWSRKARERKAALERLSALADRIGARDGHVVREHRAGGPLVSDSVSVITFRPGTPEAVARAQLDAAVAAGYTDPPAPPCASHHPCVFTAPRDLPTLWIETFPAGTTIRGTNLTVPIGHTAVLITLG